MKGSWTAQYASYLWRTECKTRDLFEIRFKNQEGEAEYLLQGYRYTCPKELRGVCIFVPV